MAEERERTYVFEAIDRELHSDGSFTHSGFSAPYEVKDGKIVVLRRDLSYFEGPGTGFRFVEVSTRLPTIPKHLRDFYAPPRAVGTDPEEQRELARATGTELESRQATADEAAPREG